MTYPTNPIDSLMIDKGNVSSNDAALRNNLEYFLPTIKREGISGITTIEPSVGDRYVGDFYGLLSTLGVIEELRWITMRVNGLPGPDVYDGKLLAISLVDPSYYARIVSVYTSNKKKSKA